MLIINVTKFIFIRVLINFWKFFNVKYFVFFIILIFLYSFNTYLVLAKTDSNILNSTHLKYAGTINSLYFPSNAKEINSVEIMQNSYILGGIWEIEIIKKELRFFKVNISMMDLNGDFKHNHILTYKFQKQGIAILPDLVKIKENNYDNNLDENNNITAEISFIVRAKLITEGIVEPNDTALDVIIKNGNIMMIKFKDNGRIKDHFKQPIFGIVDKIG